MFIKVTHSGPRSYVQLVEAYRDDAGRPKQRTVATLGRLDQLNSELDCVIAGLLRVTGKSAPAAAAAPTVSFESARDFGDVLLRPSKSKAPQPPDIPVFLRSFLETLPVCARDGAQTR